MSIDARIWRVYVYGAFSIEQTATSVCLDWNERMEYQAKHWRLRHFNWTNQIWFSILSRWRWKKSNVFFILSSQWARDRGQFDNVIGIMIWILWMVDASAYLSNIIDNEDNCHVDYSTNFAWRITNNSYKIFRVLAKFN